MWYFYQLTCSVRLLWCGCNKMIQLVQVWLCVGGECQPCLRSVQSQQTKPWSTCWYTCVVQRSKFLWSNTQCLPSHVRYLLLLTAKSRNIFSLVVEQDCRMKQDRFPCQLVWNCLSQADCPTERYNFDHTTELCMPWYIDWHNVTYKGKGARWQKAEEMFLSLLRTSK